MDLQRFQCVRCEMIKLEDGYLPSRCRFHRQSHIPICTECILKEYNDLPEESIIPWIDALCQYANLPFDIEKWDAAYTANGYEAPIAYMRLVAQQTRPQENDWQTFSKRYIAILNTHDDYELTDTTKSAKLKELADFWGNAYTDEELFKLDKFYQGLIDSYGKGNPTIDDTGRKLCRLSIEIDRTIANGAQGIDKLITAYGKLQEMGGFKAEQAHDYNSFESISELTMYMEKIGWKNKFVNDEPQDIIDFTMRDIQLHNKRLYTNEATISDQIDNRLTTKARIEQVEMQMRDEEIEDLDNRQYDTSSLDWDNEPEEFDPSII